MEVSQSITVNGSVVHNELLDDHSELEPPDPIPNSEVKRLSADGSVGFPHVRVGHRQALKSKTPFSDLKGVFLYRYLHLHLFFFIKTMRRRLDLTSLTA